MMRRVGAVKMLRWKLLFDTGTTENWGIESGEELEALVKKRLAEDDGTRYSHDEVWARMDEYEETEKNSGGVGCGDCITFRTKH